MLGAEERKEYEREDSVQDRRKRRRRMRGTKAGRKRRRKKKEEKEGTEGEVKIHSELYCSIV